MLRLSDPLNRDLRQYSCYTPLWRPFAERSERAALTCDTPPRPPPPYPTPPPQHNFAMPPRPQGPCHTKNTTVIVFHYVGSKTLRRQQNATTRSLKHLVFLGKIHTKSPQIVNYYGDRELLRRSIFSMAGSFGEGGYTILTQIMADEFNFLWSEIQITLQRQMQI